MAGLKLGGRKKDAILKACYGFSLPSRSGGSSKVCPLLDGLAREGLELREAVCTAYPGLVEAMCLARRPRPETSAVAMLLLDLENRWMRGFVELLPRHNFRLVASIFDAVVALPTAQADEEGLLQEFQDLCGLAMQVRPACPPAFCDGVQEALARLTAAGKGVLDAQTETVAGEAMCIPTAVINLFPCAAASVKMSMSGKQGPLSYSQFLDLCPDFVIEALPVADAAAAQDNASFLLHEGRVQQSQCGHAFGVQLDGAQIVVSSSEQEETWRGNRAAFWTEVQCLPGVKCFRTGGVVLCLKTLV